MAKFPYQNGGKVKSITKTITLASQAAGEEFTVGPVPQGAAIKNIEFLASATLGASATVAIGDGTTVDKYRAAATFTTANTAVSVIKAVAALTPLTADESIVLTTAVAALPASGTLHVIVEYVID